MQFHAVKSADETDPLIVFVQSYEARSNMSLNIEFCNPKPREKSGLCAQMSEK